MVDEKKMRGEEEHVITPGEIKAWKRGDKDALRNKLLRASSKLSPERAVALVKLFAQFGDIHALAMRLDVGVEEVRQVLNSFDVRSIEDARALVNSGVIAEFDRAKEAEAVADEIERREDHAAAQERLDEQQKKDAPIIKTTEEIDDDLAILREEAQRKNKSDQIRALVAEGIDPSTGRSGFRIALNQVTEFKKLIPYGVGQLQRRFGGSKADIVSEIKRLAPSYNADMLRP